MRSPLRRPVPRPQWGRNQSSRAPQWGVQHSSPLGLGHPIALLPRRRLGILESVDWIQWSPASVAGEHGVAWSTLRNRGTDRRCDLVHPSLRWQASRNPPFQNLGGCENQGPNTGAHLGTPCGEGESRFGAWRVWNDALGSRRRRFAASLSLRRFPSGLPQLACLPPKPPIANS